MLGRLNHTRIAVELVVQIEGLGTTRHGHHHDSLRIVEAGNFLRIELPFDLISIFDVINYRQLQRVR